MIRLKKLLKEESFTATNKDTGKVSVFKSKDSRDAAIKAGTHEKSKESDDDTSKPKGNNMFSAGSYDAPDLDKGKSKGNDKGGDDSETSSYKDKSTNDWTADDYDTAAGEVLDTVPHFKKPSGQVWLELDEWEKLPRDKKIETLETAKKATEAFNELQTKADVREEQYYSRAEKAKQRFDKAVNNMTDEEREDYDKMVTQSGKSYEDGLSEFLKKHPKAGGVSSKYAKSVLAAKKKSEDALTAFNAAEKKGFFTDGDIEDMENHLNDEGGKNEGVNRRYNKRIFY